MQDDFKILLVERFDVLGEEGVGIKYQRAMAGVPPVRAIAGAEINESVAWQFFLAKRARNLQRLLRPRESAMRLEVTQRPLRRHDRLACQSHIFCKRIGWLLDVNDKE